MGRVSQVWPGVSEHIFLKPGSRARVPLCSNSLSGRLEHRPVKATLVDSHSWTVLPVESHEDLGALSVDTLVVIDMVSRGVEYSNHGSIACDKHTVCVLVPALGTCPEHSQLV